MATNEKNLFTFATACGINGCNTLMPKKVWRIRTQPWAGRSVHTPRDGLGWACVVLWSWAGLVGLNRWMIT